MPRPSGTAKVSDVVTVTTPDSPAKKEEDVALDCPGGHEVIGKKNKNDNLVFKCHEHRWYATVHRKSPLLRL
jgi:hypothetical protein